MKKKQIIIGLIILIGGGFLLFLLDNKTFFKSKYENIPIPMFSYYKNSNTFHSFRSESTLNKSINKYLNTLDKCDTGDYYFDKERNITIINYSVEKDGIIKVIHLDFEEGNSCSEQFSLKSDWYKQIKDIKNIEKITCENDDCTTSTVDIDLAKLKNDLTNFKRIDNKDYVDFNYESDNIYLGIYLEKETIRLFPYDKNTLGVILISDNKSNQSALYNLDGSVNEYLESLVK